VVGDGGADVGVEVDGGFGQYVAELTTAVKCDTDLTHVLPTDDELGKRSEEQRDGGWPI
jgi:thiamine pyrophosphate-dependent acetolactate synthase large subunit-like protein